MTRTTLGLFGAARRTEATNDRKTDTYADAADAYRQERLSGLTPIERDVVETRMAANTVLG